MAPLLAHFDAAAMGDPSPQSDTPLPRIPPKKPNEITAKATRPSYAVPMRNMWRASLYDVTNDQELGMVIAAHEIDKKTTRIHTTLTAVHVRGGRVIRGRLHGRGLYGVEVAQIEHM